MPVTSTLTAPAAGRPAQFRALDRDERRAESLQAGVVLVAARLVDRALAPELRLERLDRDAVRLGRAVAAALADERVDQHAPARVGHPAALAPPPLLGGADLVVDDRRHARDLAQRALHVVELGAIVHGDAGGEAGRVAVLADVVADDGDARDALGPQLMGDLGHRQLAFDRLAAGHRDRVVVEDLVGQVDARIHGGAHRQQPGMKIRAVAEVLKSVGLRAERRDPGPGQALPAHLRRRQRIAVHVERHRVAADAGECEAPVRHFRRGVVRAAGAEVRRPAAGRRAPRPRRREPLLDQLQARVERRIGEPEAREARADDARDLQRLEHDVGRQQRPARRVALAGEPRPLGIRQVEERVRGLGLDERRLLLDDQQLRAVACERRQSRRLERPDQRRLVDGDPERDEALLVEAERRERRDHVEPRLAGRDDPEPAPGRRPVRDAIEAVGTHVGLGERQLVAREPHLVALRVEREPRVHAAGRDLGALGLADPQPRRVDLDRRGRLDRLVDALEPDPHAGAARQREAVQAEVEVLLDARRIEHRDAVRRERLFALMGGRRALAGVIVAERKEDAAVRGRAHPVRVLDRVPRAVDAGALAVPDREHAVDLRPGQQRDLLCAPDRGGGEVLVDARLELDLRRGEQLAGRRQLLVVAAERRAAVAADVARSIETGRRIARTLHQRQTHERLRAAQEHAAGLTAVLVVEPDGIVHRVTGRVRRAVAALLCHRPARPGSSAGRGARMPVSARCRGDRDSAMAIWFQTFDIASLRELSRNTLDEQLGIEFDACGDDWLSATMPVDRRTQQPFGLLHGGASVALAESLGSIGASLCVDRARFRCVGQSIHANHLRAVRDGTVTGTARPLHLGRRSHVWQIEVRQPAGQLVCVAQLTMAVLPLA
jgi:uncharacterized protein (TIGR00369 family)